MPRETQGKILRVLVDQNFLRAEARPAFMSMSASSIELARSAALIADVCSARIFPSSAVAGPSLAANARISPNSRRGAAVGDNRLPRRLIADDAKRFCNRTIGPAI